MHQLGPVYEDPDAFKLDPHTQDNLAYGHVQQSVKLQGPIYEDIKPDPHTQGNIAYGHVHSKNTPVKVTNSSGELHHFPTSPVQKSDNVTIVLFSPAK